MNKKKKVNIKYKNNNFNKLIRSHYNKIILKKSFKK